MADAKIYFEIETAVGGYVWRIRTHGNHEILCASEILKERSTCVYAMSLVRDEAHTKTAYWDRNAQEWVSF